MLEFAPFDAVFGVAYHLFVWLSASISPVFGGAAAAVAIVLGTVAVRLLLLPLTLRQVRAERVRTRLAPQLAALRERHRGDPQGLSRDMTQLYRAQGASPFAGFLPGLAQAPFFLLLYQLCLSTDVQGAPNALMTSALAGVPLAERWVSGGLVGAHDVVFLALFAVIALLAWWSSRRLRGAPIPLLRLLPFATLVVAATVPLAAGLYLVTTTAWTALETAVLRRDPPFASSP